MEQEDIEARIFVGGLDQDCDEQALEKAFSMFGEITQVLVMKDRDTNQSRGFGFISFEDQASADDAIRRMHGVEVMGRCVTVRKAARQGTVERPRRGGFRGGRGGDRFGGRSDSRYESRGRGSYSGGRRQSNDDYHQSSYSSRGGSTYRDSRRGGFDSSRLGHGRDGYDSSRGGGYVERQSSDFDTLGRGYSDDRYSSSRKSYPDSKYSDSRRDDGGRGYGDPPMSSRDGYSSSRYESSTRFRSRSPVGRYGYREESPTISAKSRRAGDSYRDYSPVQGRRQNTREYSPVIETRAGYGGDTFREFSPPSSRGRGRQPSPDQFAQPRSRARAGSPLVRERPSYPDSRSTGNNRSSPPRRSEYSSTRSQEFSGRGGRYNSSSNRGSRHANGQDRGPGSRSAYAGPTDAAPPRSKYPSARHGSSPSRSGAREDFPRGLKRTIRQSASPVERRSARRM